MSSYSISHGDYLIVIGWDAKLDTFFAVADYTDEALPNDAGDEPLLWLGSGAGSYRDINTFLRDLEKELNAVGVEGFSLSETMQMQLQADYAARPPGTGRQETSSAILSLIDALQKSIDD